jgi:hypothetical protein
MNRILSGAVSLAPNIRRNIGIQVLSWSEPISHLADKHQVSQKFVYQQSIKRNISLLESTDAVSPSPSTAVFAAQPNVSCQQREFQFMQDT